MRLNVVQKFTLLSIAATVVIAVSLSLLVSLRLVVGGQLISRWLLGGSLVLLNLPVSLRPSGRRQRRVGLPLSSR